MVTRGAYGDSSATGARLLNNLKALFAWATSSSTGSRCAQANDGGHLGSLYPNCKLVNSHGRSGNARISFLIDARQNIGRSVTLIRL